MKKEDKDKQTARNFFIFLIILIAIFGIIAYGIPYIQKLRGSVDSYNYNGFDFKKMKCPSSNIECWYGNIYVNGKQYLIPFRYGPKEVEDIGIGRGIRDEIINFDPKGVVFMALDPEYDSKAVIGAVEVSRILGKKYNLLNLTVASAFTREYKDYNKTVINCDYVNNPNPLNYSALVIEYRVEDLPTNVRQEGKCVVVSGKDTEELIRASDALAYNIFGIRI